MIDPLFTGLLTHMPNFIPIGSYLTHANSPIYVLSLRQIKKNILQIKKKKIFHPHVVKGII